MSDLKHTVYMRQDRMSEQWIPCGVSCPDAVAFDRRTQPEATAPAKDLGAAILALPLPGGSAASTFDPKEHVYSAWQMRELLKSAAALASPADALVAGDSETAKDAERYRYIRDTATLDNAVWEALEGYGMTNGAGELLEDEYRAGMDRAIDRAIQAQKDGHG